MKSLFLFALLVVLSLAAAAQSRYVITYATPLNGGQISKLVNTAITQFSPACRPNSISVNSTSCSMLFGSQCMGAQELIAISDRTLAPDRVAVARVTRDGAQIWPLANIKKKGPRG